MTETRVALFDRGRRVSVQDGYLQRWVIEDPEGGDPSVGVFGELLADCYVPPVMPEVWGD